MAQQNDTSVLNFIAGEALEADRRVKLSGAVLRTVIYADAGEPCIGVTQRGVLIAADVPVKMIASGTGSFKIETAGVTTVNAKLYGAADGKVSETVSGAAEWFGRAAASGSGSIIECIPTSAAVVGGGAAALDWQESVADRLTAPGGGEAVGYRALVISAATGAFETEEDSIAILEEDGSWTFIAPTEGFAVAVEDEDVKYFYNGSAWVGNAHIVDLTDNTGGTANDTLVADAATMILCIPVADMVKIADADLVTDFLPGFAGKILSVSWVQEDPVTTSGKLSDLDFHINATPITGGQIALTSAACTPLGKVIAGAAITALNVFGAGDTISIVGSTTTAFIEGSGSVQIVLAASAVNDNLADIAAKTNAILAQLAAIGLQAPA